MVMMMSMISLMMIVTILMMTIEMAMNGDGFDCDDDCDDDDNINSNINHRPSSRAEKNWLQMRSMRPECMGVYNMHAYVMIMIILIDSYSLKQKHNT